MNAQNAQQTEQQRPKAANSHDQKSTPNTKDGRPADAQQLKGNQGYRDKDGNTWKKDMKHKDHWDVSDRKGHKIKEVDYNGKQVWPDGPKNTKQVAAANIPIRVLSQHLCGEGSNERLMTWSRTPIWNFARARNMSSGIFARL